MARPPFQNEHDYAVIQEVQRHDDAIHWYGEMAACALLWHVEDFENGYVGRCSVCYTAYGEIADAYEQGSRNKCPNCYGTTFEGGLRALLYRPVLWGEAINAENEGKRGVSRNASGTLQMTSDFRMRDNDFIIRQDRTRWRITEPQEAEIVTGFGPTGRQIPIGSDVRIQREDRTSVAYLIPVDQNTLEVIGWKPYMIYPTSADIVNAPVFPTIDLEDGAWDETFWSEFYWSEP